MNDDNDRPTADAEDLTQALGGRQTAALLGLLSSSDDAMRQAAAMVLQRRGEPAAFAHAAELLQHGGAECRDIAAFLLGQLGYASGLPYREESIPLLEAALRRDPSAEVRASAAAALGFLAARDSLVDVMRAAADPDPQVRLAVAEALGRLAMPECVPVLERLLRDPDSDVAEWARTGMEMLVGRQLDGVSSRDLRKITRDTSRDRLHRKVAAEILAQRDGPLACEEGLRLAMVAEDQLRISAVFLLTAAAVWNDASRPDVIPFLVDLVRHDPDEAVRRASADGLAELGETVLRAVLADAASGPDATVQDSAAWALRCMSTWDKRGVGLAERLMGDVAPSGRAGGAGAPRSLTVIETAKH